MSVLCLAVPPATLADSVHSQTTERLLASGGDSRHVVGADGRNRYGNRYRPESGLVTLGSCTSSTLSNEAYVAAAQLHHWLRTLDRDWLPAAIDDAYERARTELTSHILPGLEPRPAVVLTPSGTDAEFVPVLAALQKHERITNILVGSGEAGSGSAMAAAGHHFDLRAPSERPVTPGVPVDDEVAARVESVNVAIRDESGDPRPTTDIDGEVGEIARSRAGAGRGVLLHVIAHSKTGLHAPSLKTVHDLVSSYPGRVDVVIDAAQGRFSRAGLHDAVSRGYVVITTGSKFFGGPPFAGAVILPQAGDVGLGKLPSRFADYFSAAMFPRTWQASRASLPGCENIGLVLRWWAALVEFRTYYAVPAKQRFEVLRRLQGEVPRRIRTSSLLVSTTVPPPATERLPRRLLESNVTVFSFACRTPGGQDLSQEDLAEVRRFMREPWRVDDGNVGREAALRDLQVEIGQPVPVGPGKSDPAYLRLAIGAREIVQACRRGPEGSDGVDGLLADVSHTVSKLDAAIRGRGAQVS